MGSEKARAGACILVAVPAYPVQKVMAEDSSLRICIKVDFFLSEITCFSVHRSVFKVLSMYCCLVVNLLESLEA